MLMAQHTGMAYAPHKRQKQLPVLLVGPLLLTSDLGDAQGLCLLVLADALGLGRL